MDNQKFWQYTLTFQKRTLLVGYPGLYYGSHCRVGLIVGSIVRHTHFIEQKENLFLKLQKSTSNEFQNFNYYLLYFKRVCNGQIVYSYLQISSNHVSSFMFVFVCNRVSNKQKLSTNVDQSNRVHN